MKKLTGICVLLLLLTYCEKKEGGTVGTVDKDSSPIIIADGGSVHLKQRDHFRIHGPNQASAKLGKFSPSMIGYQCDPDKGACTAGDCRTTLQLNCYVKLDGSDWSLSVYDDTDANVATLSWTSSTDKEKVAIDLPTPFAILHTGDFAELVPSKNHLKSVRFEGGGQPITFTCTPTMRCVVVGYTCTSGCPAKP